MSCLHDLPDFARDQGATIEPLAEGQSDSARKLPPIVVANLNVAM
jgi:hypothetical protein